MYSLKITNTARKALRRLPAATRERIREKIRDLQEQPRPEGAKQMQGKRWKGHHRIRVGDYRVVYRIDDGLCVVTVTRLGHRSGVYQA